MERERERLAKEEQEEAEMREDLSSLLEQVQQACKRVSVDSRIFCVVRSMLDDSVYNQ